jgi:hypothetical protein
MATNKTIPNPLPPGAEQLAGVDDVTGQIESRTNKVRYSAVACTGLRRAGQAISLSSRPANFPSMSAFGGKADMGWCTANVCFDPKRTLRGPLTSLDQIDTMPCPEPRGRR